MALQRVRRFVCRHRIKIGLAALVGGGLAGRAIYRRVMAEAERFASDLQQKLTDEYFEEYTHFMRWARASVTATVPDGAGGRRKDSLFQSRHGQRIKLLRAALVDLSPRMSAWIPAGRALERLRNLNAAKKRSFAAAKQDPSNSELKANAAAANAAFQEHFERTGELGSWSATLGAGSPLLTLCSNSAVARLIALCLATAAADTIIRVAIGATMRSARLEKGEEAGKGQGGHAGGNGLAMAEREAIVSTVVSQWIDDGAERLCALVLETVERDGHGCAAFPVPRGPADPCRPLQLLARGGC